MISEYILFSGVRDYPENLMQELNILENCMASSKLR